MDVMKINFDLPEELIAKELFLKLQTAVAAEGNDPFRPAEEEADVFHGDTDHISIAYDIGSGRDLVKAGFYSPATGAGIYQLDADAETLLVQTDIPTHASLSWQEADDTDIETEVYVTVDQAGGYDVFVGPASYEQDVLRTPLDKEDMRRLEGLKRAAVILGHLIAHDIFHLE